MKILSFHLLLETEWNRVLHGQELSSEDIAAIQNADGVILPQGCKESIYRTTCRYCSNVFPNYDARFSHPGKTGQALLFVEQGVATPRTCIIDNADHQLHCPSSSFTFPFVFKSAWGGEGEKVFLVHSEIDLQRCLELARGWEKENLGGFLFQEYIPTGGRSLRVVVIGSSMHPYWRVQAGEDGFYTNLAKGATIDTVSHPDLMAKACRRLQPFCHDTGINLAGFDFIFNEKDRDPEPLFLEINYGFRTHGLGGPDSYLMLLAQAVREWRENL